MPEPTNTRDDSVLNTGLSSAVSRRMEVKKAQEKRFKDSRRAQLTPGAEIILEWIEKEKADVVNLEKIVLNVADEKFLQAQLLARQMHLEFLNNLKNKASNILREVTKEEQKRAA